MIISMLNQPYPSQFESLALAYSANSCRVTNVSELSDKQINELERAFAHNLFSRLVGHWQSASIDMQAVADLINAKLNSDLPSRLQFSFEENTVVIELPVKAANLSCVEKEGKYFLLLAGRSHTERAILFDIFVVNELLEHEYAKRVKAKIKSNWIEAAYQQR